MPGVFQLSPDELLREVAVAVAAGVPAVLLFGIPERKDAKASGAYARDGIVQQAVRLLKKEWPDLLVITDVCLCEYMSHGHCGVVQQHQSGRGSQRSHAQTAGRRRQPRRGGADRGAQRHDDGRSRNRAKQISRVCGSPILAYAAKYASAVRAVS
jgi:porphobilinogen synthase